MTMGEWRMASGEWGKRRFFFPYSLFAIRHSQDAL